MKNFIFSAIAAATIFATSCTDQQTAGLTKSGLNPEAFKTDSTALYTLTNKNGMEVCITNYGGRIVSIMVPNKEDSLVDVVLGFDSVQKYMPENNQSDLGAAIGRYANRIDQGKITVEDSTYQLTINNGIHHLHGGTTGWQYRTFTAEQTDDQTLKLSLTSPAGDNGYPATVKVTYTYTLTDDNAIDIMAEATSDAATVVNMTNHAYFNLSGDGNNTITDNILYINAKQYTPVDDQFMTLGAIEPVAGTPLDFTTAKAVSAGIDDTTNVQIKNGHGYDHNWVLDTNCDIAQLAATVTSPISGVKLEVYTDKPGLQVYCGNFMDSSWTGKRGIVYNHRTAICLEPQVFPDSPNKYTLPGWEKCDPTVTPAKPYSHHFIYKFGVEK